MPGGDSREIARLIRRRLERDVGRGLGGFVRRLAARLDAGGAEELAAGGEVSRFLGRLGPGAARRGSAGALRELRELARAAGLDELTAALHLRLFAAGDAALGLEPVCGEMPRCHSCELSTLCAYRQGRVAEPAPARAERPAERLRLEGEDALTASELLALVLSGRGLAEARAAAVARRMLESATLRELAARAPGELASVPGMSGQLELRVRAALGLARRWSVEQREPGRQFRGGRDFFEFFSPRLRDLKTESFFVVLLDQKNRYISSRPVSVGTLTGSPVHPREVFRPAIREAAAAVAFVHNHPSGSPAPSRDDREITARLVEVARLVGVRVLDHVIVGDGEYCSFVEEGLL